MTPELTALTLAALLQILTISIMATLANIELKPGQTLGPRDPGRLGGSLQDLLSVKTARLYRACSNGFEGLALFAVATLVITFSDQGTAHTALCAWIYLAARILYVPCYAFGLTPWRTIVWTVGFLATTAMLVMALL